MTVATVGQPAPDFDLPGFDPADPANLKLRVTLGGVASGDWLVLFFYPSDFTFVCPTEILAFADHRPMFDDLGARILGCSTDTIHTHRAWAETPRDKNGIAGTNFPIAADHTGRGGRKALRRPRRGPARQRSGGLVHHRPGAASSSTP